MNKKQAPLQKNHRQDGGLLRSGLIVSAFTLLSRIFGFIRDQVIAIVFGANWVSDAFFVAFKIPNFMRRLFAEGAFAQAFVPVFTEYKETRSFDALKDLTNHVAGTLGLVLLLVTAFGVMATPLLVYLFAPGFSGEPERLKLTEEMLRITFPYLLFISLTAFSGGILNSFGRFAVPAFTPVLLNICLIAAALWGAPYFDEPIIAIAWGVFIAGLIQFGFQLPYLFRLGLLPIPKISWQHEGVKKIFRLMLPALFGSSVAQINLLLDTVIASFLAAGSISWLYYADRLVEFPLGLFGITLATIILPSLSAKYAQKSEVAFSETLTWALKIGILISLPAALGLMMLAGPIIATLFEYGAFTANDTAMSAISLIAYSFGLPAFVAIKILAPAFFSRQDTKTPVRIGIIALVANMVFNIIIVVPMVFLDSQVPHIGLALATAASAWLQVLLLASKLKSERVLTIKKTWVRWSLRLLLAMLVMAVSIYAIVPEPAFWSSQPYWERATVLLGIISMALLVFFVTLSIFGFRFSELRQSHHR